MSHEILIVVDMQNDFISGSLGTAEAQAILPAAVKKAESFAGQLVFTMDTHYEDYPQTQEGKLLPVSHCVRDTEGWRLAAPLEEIQKRTGAPVYEKGAFGSVQLAQDLAMRHKANPIERVELIGLCTDICVVSNALLIKAFLPEVPVAVDASCCAGVTPQKHDAALETMRSCQVEVIG